MEFADSLKETQEPLHLLSPEQDPFMASELSYELSYELVKYIL